ncbi:testis-expressed protein 36 [Parambassis ranga]|uniref:Testis-expressed protein 36 n=1 Tax=Parambassis ranga TaxID=210632 RepID=A0A6P7JWG1_9TELE|nr:testis-expressed protein 36 [Parambassis ranga]
MVKGGKRYSSMSNDGKWFAHPDSPESKTKTRETCTSTGAMLTQVKSSLPQALHFERYPKWKTQQKSRQYPGSDHDNKHALKEDICIFSTGVGRRKVPDHPREHISHFSLDHRGAEISAEEPRGNLSAYQADFIAKAADDVPTSTRRFPHNHQQRSAEAALAQAGEQFMWFGRHDSDLSDTLEVLAAANHSAPFRL